MTIKEKENLKHTKGVGTNGLKDKGWTDDGIARFAQLIELVRAQGSGEDRAKQEEEALEISGEPHSWKENKEAATASDRDKPTIKETRIDMLQ